MLWRKLALTSFRQEIHAVPALHLVGPHQHGQKWRNKANGIKFSDKIQITSINVNGYRAREAEIKKFIETKGESCLLAISDSRLKADTQVHAIKGYSMIRSDKVSTSTMATAGGVAILIPKKWSTIEVKLRASGPGFEAVAAVILPDAEEAHPFKIMCTYNHPGNYLPLELLTEFKNITFNGTQLAGFFMGDLNCPHAAFGSRTTNEFGNNLLQMLTNENLIFLSPQAPTYISNSTGLTNTLDIVIADHAGSNLVENCYVGEDVGSDHLPVTTVLAIRAGKMTKATRINTTLLAKLVDRRLEEFSMSDSIDESISHLTQIISECKELCTFVLKPKKRRLPPDLMTAIRLRKTLMKNRKEAHTDLARTLLTKQYNRINHKIQKQMREIRDKEIQDLSDKICGASSTNEMWKMFKRFKNNNAPIEEPQAPLKVPNGKLTSNDKEKCDEFGRYLHSVHQTPSSPMFDEQFKQAIDDEIMRQKREKAPCTIPSMTVGQMKRLLLDTKSTSASGEDGISYNLMNLCSDSSKKVFCNIINACLAENIFPKAWKEAKVIMLPKPGRDRSFACNYRPISLLSCLGKIYERHIYIYLMIELQDKGFLNAHQAGFRKKRSTQEHLFRLSQDVLNSFKKRKCTLGLFLDVKAAFDSVWRNGLKYKINKIGLSKQLENLLHSFLDSRVLNVFVNGIWSEMVELRAGTPQGACLSPILYLIFVNDIPSCLDLSIVSPSQYADDIGLWTSNSSVKEAKNQIQEELAKLEQWCRKWHVSLHPAKSKLILFSKCPRHKEELPSGPTLKLCNEEIYTVNEANFLGLTFDSRLTWEPQTRKMLARAYKRLNLLRSIAALSSNRKPKILLTLYKSTIRSIFEYASVCILTAADCHLRKLQLVQNQALRLILNSPAYVSTHDLHDCSGLHMLKTHLTDFAQKRLTTLKRTSPLIQPTINRYREVQHIKENVSILDIISLG